MLLEMGDGMDPAVVGHLEIPQGQVRHRLSSLARHVDLDELEGSADLILKGLVSSGLGADPGRQGKENGGGRERRCQPRRRPSWPRSGIWSHGIPPGRDPIYILILSRFRGAMQKWEARTVSDGRRRPIRTCVQRGGAGDWTRFAVKGRRRRGSVGVTPPRLRPWRRA